MDSAARAIAARQQNVVSARQLRAAGMTRSGIRRQVEAGWLVPIFRGVYLLGGGAPTFAQRVMSACLLAGDDAFASHRTAGGLWGLLEQDPRSIDVTTGGRRIRVEGIRCNRTIAIAASDKGTVDGVPVASPRRTLLGLAGSPGIDLGRTVDDAIRRKLVTPHALSAYVGRPDLSFARGIAELRRIAQDRCFNGVTESELESRCLALVRLHRLPTPVRQYETVVSGRKIRFDLAYPDVNIAIELDGEAPHWGRDRWQADHDRHNAYELAGWRVLRFTWWDITERPMYVVLTIAAAIGVRPRAWTRSTRS